MFDVPGAQRKLLSVVGARPQFIKAAMLSRTLAREAPGLTHLHLHTGQHYSPEMAEIFFDELDYHPDFDLKVGSGTHAYQTGKALIEIEKVLQDERPDLVIVYGDTNATLAGALAAVKLHIPVAHVEAGLRSGNRRMPEEINRIVTDAVSEILFCPTPTSVNNLKKEGRKDGVIHTGDILLDTLHYFLPRAHETSDVLDRLALNDQPFWLLTMHRPSNVDDESKLGMIIKAFIREDRPRIIFPCHPRTAKTLDKLSSHDLDNIDVIPPVSYLDMLVLEEHASLILTDSGGVQREAYFLSRPCLTLREETEWPETLEGGWNRLVGTDPERILAALKQIDPPASSPNLGAFGDGKATERMKQEILKALDL
ncbi:UDP-N-acetylglucosamine 2-epimerase (non-hydrolyzing) [candidate division WOR-3 bacterium]|nr:UDP-N-acetylglucosamine 2-epimerase (non-hydrolyzing) [candidate division WOR-3 bacterium]